MSSKKLLFGGKTLPFTFTVKTDNAGVSGNNQFKLPLTDAIAGTGAIVQWGDGTQDVITSHLDLACTHTYPSDGTYEIKIYGTLNAWRFNYGGDRLKMLNISNWGIFEINTPQTFFGCENMTISATDSPRITSTSLASTFHYCSNLLYLDCRGWDFSRVINLDYFISDCTSLVTLNILGCTFSNVTSIGSFATNCSLVNIIGLDTIDVTNVTLFFQMLRNCDTVNVSLANWNIINGLDFSGFMNAATGLSTANYDATLIGWEAKLQAAYPGGVGYPTSGGYNPEFGGSQYTLGSAADIARASLISTFGWTIFDGGGI